MKLALTAFTPLILLVAPVATMAGSSLLEQQCAECHSLNGPAPTTATAYRERKGPDLGYAGIKYRAEWLEQWLQKPTRNRPAGMFYGKHIKTGPKGDVVDEASLKPHPKLDAAAAKAATTALMALKEGAERIKTGDYKTGKISLSMGEMLFDKFRGCLACHQVEPGYGGVSGPEVYTIGKRLQADYLVSFMRNPKLWEPRTIMPARKLKDRDLQKFVHYFNALSAEDFQ